MTVVMQVRQSRCGDADSLSAAALDARITGKVPFYCRANTPIYFGAFFERS
jgi:hypothetical protein